MWRAGPILYFRGQAEESWRLAALVVCEGEAEPPPLTAPGLPPTAPVRIAMRNDATAWRYDFAPELGAAERSLTYTIGDRRGTICLPARHGPHRLAYTACNGSEDEPSGRPSPGRNAAWQAFGDLHRARPYHLLLQGGDQLYADRAWHSVPALAAWSRLGKRERLSAPFTPDMAAAVGDYYFHRYCWNWSLADLADCLSSIPSVMMWDDHDIFDGWGSWAPEWQSCPVFQGVYAAARAHYTLFQIGASEDALPEACWSADGTHFGATYRFGRGAIVAPDLRSERSRSNIMGPAGWRDFTEALARLDGCSRLLAMSSVPLVNADLTLAERFWNALPGHMHFEDDLRDQWQSYAHRAEWERMLRALGAHAARTGCPLTALSGEIHLGAFGTVAAEGARFTQLTAPGIVHHPPPAPMLGVYRLVGRSRMPLAPDLVARLEPIPGHGTRYLRRRGWLSIDLGEDGGLAASWMTEIGEAGRYVESSSGAAMPIAAAASPARAGKS